MKFLEFDTGVSGTSRPPLSVKFRHLPLKL